MMAALSLFVNQLYAWLLRRHVGKIYRGQVCCNQGIDLFPGLWQVAISFRVNAQSLFHTDEDYPF